MCYRGRVAIKDIKPGEDEVLARNDETGAMEYRLVKARFVHRDGTITRLTLRDKTTGTTQTLITTANHPIYVADAVMPELRLVANGSVPAEAGTTASGRWVQAGSLTRGNRLLTETGGTSEVVAVTVEDTGQDAYNLTVSEFHTYFVASPDNDNAPAVWVHNACPNANAPDFVVTPNGEAIVVPSGATGPTATRASGFQYTGGSSGNGLDDRVTGVRVMDANSNQGARAVYMNRTGQTVDPLTGRTVPNADPRAHHYLGQ